MLVWPMLRKGLPVALLALNVASALAQTPPAAPSTTVSPLTVTPEPRGPVPPVHTQAWNFVQSHGATSAVLGQISRWGEPICVKILGLPRDQGAPLADRVLAKAQEAGVPLAGERCTANIEVVFTAKPQALLDQVAQHKDGLLGFHHVAQITALKAMTRPIQAWYVTATRELTRWDVLDDPISGRPQGCGDEVQSECLQSVLKNVLVVVDKTRLQGQPMEAVADYVALLALSKPKAVDGCADLSTILELFGPGCQGRPPPDGLTATDQAYLKALYAADPRRKVQLQRSEIARRVAGIITSDRPSDGH